MSDNEREQSDGVSVPGFYTEKSDDGDDDEQVWDAPSLNLMYKQD